MERIKEIFLFLLVAGAELSKTNLIYTLSELSDLSGISNEEDFKEDSLYKELSSTVVFVNTSVEFFILAKKNKTEFDNFIEYYKNELLKIENYELITYLDL